MNDKPRSVLTFEKSILEWDNLFSDVDDGKDILRWANTTVEDFAPAMLGGQEAQGITVGPVIAPDEEVLLSFPCFFDDDPSPESQVGQGKVKFCGKTKPGVLAVTDRSVALCHEARRNPLWMVYSWPRERTVALNELPFKFSMMSMTSAGPGFELLYRNADGSPDRILFRMAVTPRRGEVAVERLRALTSNT
ncbi:MAG: hypothetical protein FWD11_05530 [Micrococcales bacterium]|nr:hypothetical protein [Micrococcales bacterium]